jgi:adenylate kinase
MNKQDAITILVCGISGVGKTRLLECLTNYFPLSVTWRASEIIGSARNIIDPETLRTLPRGEIQQSQELLIQGFKARREAFPDVLVLLDAHSVIDAERGLVDIPVEIAAHLAPSGIIHVSDDIARILQHRLADTKRVRPMRSIAQLTQYQLRSIASCERYSAALHIPLIEVRSGDMEAFTKAVQQIVTS